MKNNGKWIKSNYDEILKFLNEVVEATEPVGVPGLIHIHQAAYLASSEANMLVSNYNLQLLKSQLH